LIGCGEEEEMGEEGEAKCVWVYREEGHGTDSDEEPFQGDYVSAKWQPFRFT